MKKMSKADRFIEFANPDQNGISKWIAMDDLIKVHPDLEFGNGGNWCRKGSSIEKKYIIEKQRGKSNKIIALRLNGFNTTVAENHAIPSFARNISLNPCAVLQVHSFNEIDHKEGRYLKENYQIEDFQSLSKSVNDAKRQHCKECKESGIRFQASRLGSSIDYIEGDASSNFCQGCYWYDPVAFWKEATKGYSKGE